VEPMLEREPHPEVGGQAQRSDHLGGPDLLDGLRYGLPHLENRSSVAPTGRGRGEEEALR